MEHDDHNDWTCFRHGNRSGMERIYHRHRDTMYTYCLYMTGSRESAADIVQESFTRLMQQRHRATFDSLRNWLFICVRNLTLNHLRRARRHPVAETLSNPVCTPEQILFVKNILDRLDPDDRDIILLREHHGFAVTEIATMLDLTPEAARVRLHRARKKMRQLAKG